MQKSSLMICSVALALVSVGCTSTQSAPPNGTASTTGQDNEIGPRVTEAVERDYFTLRERIETSGKIQDYIRQQCFR